MKTIYLDSDFRCFLTDDGNMRAIETDFFDGLCDEMVAYYRFVPEGENWTRDDGEVFTGEMVSPWRELDAEVMAIQRALELDLLAQRTEELQNAVTLAEIDAAYKEGVNAV